MHTMTIYYIPYISLLCSPVHHSECIICSLVAQHTPVVHVPISNLQTCFLLCYCGKCNQEECGGCCYCLLLQHDGLNHILS